jgi:hypothetical protein
MDNVMKEGKFTVETYARENNLTRQSALNKLSQLKKVGFVTVVGGGKQKRIYTVHKTPQILSNGFYALVNKYSPEKLNPKFSHKVIGNYTVEHAIIDGIKIGDVRTLEATTHLFRHINNWKRLFELAKKHDVTEQVYKLYAKAKANFKTKTMPKRYRKK